MADGQRKRTIDAIMKALGFELLEFAELEDLDHILSGIRRRHFTEHLMNSDAIFMEKSESLSLYS